MRITNIISQLQSDPVAFLASMLMQIPAVLLALTFHEVAHGWVARRCGDNTAYMMGRLSLNPLHHLDPLGTICMLFLGFGWAKPVPVNPRNFKNFRRDDLLVSLAGIVTNLILFLLTTLLMVGVNQLAFDPEAAKSIRPSSFLNINYSGFWMIYGGSIEYLSDLGLLRAPWLLYVQRFLMVFSTLNLGLAIFNLLPIPPLDGYHVVNDILLKGRLQLSGRAFMLCQGAVMALCFFTNIVSNLMSTVMYFVQSNVVTFFLMIFGLS